MPAIGTSAKAESLPFRERYAAMPTPPPSKRIIAQLIQFIEVDPAVKEDGVTDWQVTLRPHTDRHTDRYIDLEIKNAECNYRTWKKPVISMICKQQARGFIWKNLFFENYAAQRD